MYSIPSLQALWDIFCRGTSWETRRNKKEKTIKSSKCFLMFAVFFNTVEIKLSPKFLLIHNAL